MSGQSVCGGEHLQSMHGDPPSLWGYWCFSGRSEPSDNVTRSIIETCVLPVLFGCENSKYFLALLTGMSDYACAIFARRIVYIHATILFLS